MTDTMTETTVQDDFAPWTSTDPENREAPLTLDIPVTFRVTLDPAQTPYVVANMIALVGPDVTAEAARSAVQEALTDLLTEVNERGTYFIVSQV